MITIIQIDEFEFKLSSSEDINHIFIANIIMNESLILVLNQTTLLVNIVGWVNFLILRPTCSVGNSLNPHMFEPSALRGIKITEHDFQTRW